MVKSEYGDTGLGPAAGGDGWRVDLELRRVLYTL